MPRPTTSAEALDDGQKKALVTKIEQTTGKKALIDPQPMQPGDVKDTFADISAIERELGFQPTTTIDDGVPRFVEWYREYNGI